MHLPDMIQVNKLGEFLTDHIISSSCLKKKEEKNTHFASGKRFLDLRHFTPIIPPTQRTKQPWSHNQI
jgi:hypothetical protein